METPKHFTFAECIKSDTAKKKGIENIPSWDEIDCLRNLCLIVDKVREMWNSPLYISSGYRCQKLNAAVGGVGNSQHVKGEALDIQVSGKMLSDTKKLFQMIKGMDITFDQCILEIRGTRSWIHISAKLDSSKNRKQFLTISK